MAGDLSTLPDYPSEEKKKANSLCGIQGLMESGPKMSPAGLSLLISFILVKTNYIQGPGNDQLHGSV